MEENNETGTYSLLQLPAELLSTIMNRLDGLSLVMLEATNTLFRTPKELGAGQEARSWTETVAGKKVRELRRKLGHPLHSFSSTLNWKLQLHLETSYSSLDYTRAAEAGVHSYQSAVSSSAAFLRLPTIGPVMLTSKASTRHCPLLHWHITSLCNPALEVGVIPRSLEGQSSALHHARQAKDFPAANGCRSSITKGSRLQHSFDNSEGSMVKIVAGRGWWRICIMTLAQIDNSPIKRYLLKEVSGEFPIEADMKLAMTLWADAKLRLEHPLACHTFLQATMARGYLAQSEAKDLFEQVIGGASLGFGEFLAALNLHLEFLQLQLRQIRSPSDNAGYVGFVNKAADEPSKSGTRLSIPQNNFFRALLESIAGREVSEDGPGYITSIEALNTSLSQPSQASQAAASTQQPKGAKLTMQEKNDTLDLLVSQGWLAHAPQSSNGYTIGPRSFLELQEFLLSLDLPDATRQAWQDVL
ncbi:hypothetical protein WJX84_003766 [Apatococcus fuscideae]|uniref:Non-structural maintenance of chromosomes element 1 homolog n=1 Tax=Apatococcus fuscideae TaxID=2026836 RepID=A0AAW1TFC9_9CHLO